MIRFMIYKELLSIIKRQYMYFLISLLIVLFIVGGFSSSKLYEEHIDYYDRYGHNTAETNPNYRRINYPPNTAFFICRDSHKTATASFFLQLIEYNIQQGDTEKGNPYLPQSYPLDWTFLIQMFVSLVAVLLSYSAFSDEIERGTLSLIGSNSISRLQIFIGKFVALFSVSSFMLLLPVAAGLITVQAIGIIPVSNDLIIRFLLFLGVSFLYMSLFLLIGMSVSLITRRSTISLFIASSIWLIIVVIIPECSEIIVKRVQNNPSDMELAQQYDQVYEAFYNVYFAIGKNIENNQPYSEEELQKAIKVAQAELINLGESTVPKFQKASDYILQTRRNRIAKRRMWKMLSPSILYRDISEKIMYAGSYRFLDFYGQVRVFWFRFVEDMERKYGLFHPQTRTPSANSKPVGLILVSICQIINIIIWNSRTIHQLYWNL